MNNFEETVLKVFHIKPDGTIIMMIFQEDLLHGCVNNVSTATIAEVEGLNTIYYEDKLNLIYKNIEEENPDIQVIRLGDMDDSTSLKQGVQGMNDFNSTIIQINDQKREIRLPNIPSLIRCQNCETNFSTKYQYQRHQCEFNAQKVVLKPDVEIKDIDKTNKTKYNCEVCGKSFVSKNNLDRHKTCHDSNQENVCEHCNKVFVSENRLRIHKENHCKKAGDTTKFYRSDVAVWQCGKCKQVFATLQAGNKHIEKCSEMIDLDSMKAEKMDVESSDEMKMDVTSNEDFEKLLISGNSQESFCCPSKVTEATASISNTVCTVQKVITEMLLQCEYCNRTYSDKETLMCHQKTHTTEKNYECVNCNESFDNYMEAMTHWQTKCTEDVSFFYLPKMSYCEYCDRRFKSHELLYNHKSKKKHYTPKLYFSQDNVKEVASEGNGGNGEQDADGEEEDSSEKGDVIVKLIKEVMRKIEDDKLKSEEEENHRENTMVKSENDIKEDDIFKNGKKKRGRKRKWPKVNFKTRKYIKIDEGYKYQCERCGMTLDDIAALDVHKESKHAMTYSCNECDQVVHSAKALMIHCRAHQSLKPYVCEQCGRSYSQTSHLWQHMRFHQGIKPFACPHEGCEARYTIRPDLKDHIRKVHTRERPFKCAVCQKCFLTGSVYYQHRLIHTNDRRYGCDICNKRFFRADALNNHRRIHTDERPYPCPVCGREFRQKGDRNKHVRTQHP